MAEHRLKDLAGTRAPKFGHFIVEFATPGIGHILKSAGCDFVLFDLEHSGFGFETVKSAIRYFEAGDVPVIVRVPSKEYHHIARAMDMGAEGLMLPMVGTVAEARHILNSMKYTPEGGRGVALQVSHDRYRPGAVTDKFTAANKRSTFFCQIETAEGVENAEKIAALPESTAFGSAISTSRSRLAYRASSARRPSPTPSRAWSPLLRSMASRSGAWCRPSSKASSSTARASTSSAIRAMSGCCMTPSPTRSTNCAPAAPQDAEERSHERALSRRSLGRFPQSRRLPRLSRFRPRASAQRARCGIRLSRAREPDPCGPACRFRRPDPPRASLHAREHPSQWKARRGGPLRRRLRHRGCRGLHQGRHRPRHHAGWRPQAGGCVHHHADAGAHR